MIPEISIVCVGLGIIILIRSHLRKRMFYYRQHVTNHWYIKKGYLNPATLPRYTRSRTEWALRLLGFILFIGGGMLLALDIIANA